MMNRLVSFARSTTGAHRAGALAGLALGATALAAANAQSPAAEAEAERRDRKPLGRSMMYARDPGNRTPECCSWSSLVLVHDRR